MKYFYIVLLTLAHFQINSQDQYAIVIEPVVDLLGQSMKKTHKGLDYYQNIPVSSVNSLDGVSCPRIHQLLFNETVKVLNETAKEALIEVPNIFYQKYGSPIKKNIFWILKSNLVSLNKLKKLKIDISKFPEPIDFKKDINNKKIITLVEPYYDKLTQMTYSAGTRFVYKDESPNNYIVYIFDFKKLEFKPIEIPKNICILNTNKSINNKVKNFIKLLKKWTLLENRFIPYVWGGSSFCNICYDNTFDTINMKKKGQQINYFQLPSYLDKIKTGFDCSGLILRAAQICEIPFYFKNTITMAQNLDALSKTDKIENGDLIWIPGHIIAIVDVENNLCVEAADYSRGYGKVQKIELYKMFKDINNFKDLKRCYLRKQKIKRLNSESKIIAEIPFKILKLKSAWRENNNPS